MPLAAPPAPPALPPILLEARGPDLRRVGPLQSLTKATLIPRWRAVGAWTVELPYDALDPEILAAMRAGGGLIATRGAQTLMSGPYMSEQLVRTVDARGGETRTLTLSGVSDDVWLPWRLAYPDPAHAAEAQTADHDVREGHAETVLKGYVGANLGPGALAPRRIPLTIAPDTARGATVSTAARFDTLLELAQSVCVAGGDIGWTLQQQGGGLMFDVVVPRDLSATARFGVGLNNLRGYTLSKAAPTVTRPHVAGGGEGVARLIVTATDTAAEAQWARSIEVFVDRRDSDDAVVLTQAAQEAIAAGAATAGLQIEPVDVPDLQYAVHYGVGDRVAVEPGGLPVVDVVREATLTLDKGAWSAVPAIGGQDSTSTPAFYKRLAQLEQLVRRLHTRL